MLFIYKYVFICGLYEESNLTGGLNFYMLIWPSSWGFWWEYLLTFYR